MNKPKVDEKGIVNDEVIGVQTKGQRQSHWSSDTVEIFVSTKLKNSG